jgi:hypothetical protein
VRIAGEKPATKKLAELKALANAQPIGPAETILLGVVQKAPKETTPGVELRLEHS